MQRRRRPGSGASAPRGQAGTQGGGADAAAILADTTKFADASARLAKRFFDAVSVLLMPADRLNKGIVKDLHH